MFQKINDRINVTIETDVTKSADDIMTLLKEKAKNHKWYSFLAPGQIDFKEFKFLNTEIDILRMPNTFWPFRPFGKIKLTLLEITPTQTKVKCKIMTGNNSIPWILTIQTIILLLWSTFWILMSGNLDLWTRFSAPIVILIIANGIFYIKYRSDRRSLIYYSDKILKLLRE